MISISQCKERAAGSLSGNWGRFAIAVIIYYILMGVPAFSLSYAVVDGLGNIVQILLLPLFYGLMVMCLNQARGKRADIEQMFEGFYDYVRIFTTMLLTGIYTVLWSLLLIVPGIIKSYSYSMTPFILKDYPGMKNNDAIDESIDMMKGHKKELFLLDLSMIGWFILSCLTLGIGFLFLIPYNYTAHAHFYEELKKEREENITDDEFN